MIEDFKLAFFDVSDRDKWIRHLITFLYFISLLCIYLNEVSPYAVKWRKIELKKFFAYFIHSQLYSQIINFIFLLLSKKPTTCM